MKRGSSNLNKQQGIATILIVLMISLGMVGATMGMAYSMRGNQEVQVAAHASTNSQAGTWAAAEIFRKYLYQIHGDTTILNDLDGELGMQVAGLPAGLQLKADVVSVAPPTVDDEFYLVTANIQARDALAKSATVLQVQYEVYPSCGAGELDSAMDFYRDLDVEGSVTLETDGSNPIDSTVTIDGSATFTDVSANNFGTVMATGDLTLGSGTTMEEVRTNGNLTLVDGANVSKAYAIGTITTSGGTIEVEGQANGDILLGVGNQGSIYTLGDLTSNGYVNAQLFNVAGNVSTSSVGTLAKLEAVGDVKISGYAYTITDIESKGDVVCDGYLENFTSIKANGQVTGCNEYSGSIENGQSVEFDIMDELEPFTMSPLQVNAWSVKEVANYVIFLDESGLLKVDVKNINTIENGEYFIGKKINQEANYLCKELLDETQLICSESSGQELKKICQAQSDVEFCFSILTDDGFSLEGSGYPDGVVFEEENAPEILMIEGTNMAPGIVWFDGGIVLSNGTYYNTFVATGNIAVWGAHTTQAPNYVGYDAICTNAFPVNTDSDYDGMYPIDLCDIDGGVMKNKALANISVMAGSYLPDDDTTYVGGDIFLSTSASLSGSVLAGNNLNTNGSTEVRGYVSASGLGDFGVGNVLGGSTTINLTGLPATYNPAQIPSFDGNGSSSCSGVEADTVITRWTRYL